MPNLSFPLSSEYVGDTNWSFPENDSSLELTFDTIGGENAVNLSLSTQPDSFSGEAIGEYTIEDLSSLSSPSSVTVNVFSLNYECGVTDGTWEITYIKLSNVAETSSVTLWSDGVSGSEASDSGTIDISPSYSIPSSWISDGSFLILVGVVISEDAGTNNLRFNGSIESSVSSNSKAGLKGGTSAFGIFKTNFCNVWMFISSSQGWILNSGTFDTSLGVNAGAYNEYFNNSFGNPSGGISANVETGDKVTTYEGFMSTARVLSGASVALTWEEIGVPSGAYVTEVYAEFDYSVLITSPNGTDVVGVGRLDIIHDNRSITKTIIPQKILTEGVEYSNTIQSAWQSESSSGFVSLVAPELASKDIIVNLYYKIGEQRGDGVDSNPASSQIDTISYDNVRICARYTSYATVGGNTSIAADILGIAEGKAAVNGSTSIAADLSSFLSFGSLISGSTNIISDISARAGKESTIGGSTGLVADISASANLSVGVGGSTSILSTISSRGIMISLLSGSTSILSDISQLNDRESVLSGNTSISASPIAITSRNADLGGNTGIVANITSLISSPSVLGGSTGVIAVISAVADISSTIKGSTGLNKSILDDETSGLRNIVSTIGGSTSIVSIISYIKDIDSLISGQSSIEADIGYKINNDAAISGSTSIIANISYKKNADSSLSGSTSISAAIVGIGVNDVLLSGQTSISATAIAITQIYAELSGSTSISPTQTSTAEKESALSGNTSIISFIEDANEGVKNRTATLGGSTAIFPPPIIGGIGNMSCTLSGSTSVRSRIKKQCCWYLGDIPVAPFAIGDTEICQVYLGDDSMFTKIS